MVKKVVPLLVMLAIPALAADDYTEWLYYRNITLNTRPTGAGVTVNVPNFPVLIRLTPADSLVFKNSRRNGQDARFSKSTGTHFPYHVERWDSAGRAAELWVLVDTVKGNDNTQYIKMYWGNKSAADSSRASAVFDTANGYMGVYHVAGHLGDASAAGNDGHDSGTVDTASGIVGRARSFNGASYFHISDLADRPRGTISCWFRPRANFDSSTVYNNGLWGKKESDAVNSTLSLRGTRFQSGDGKPGCIQTKIDRSAVAYYCAGTTHTFSAGVWYYVTWGWDSDFDAVYLNGALEKSIDSGAMVGGIANDEIGRSSYDSAANMPGQSKVPHYFYGTMDEIRIEKTLRSSAWVKLCYKNQRLTGIADSLTIPGAIQAMDRDSLFYAIRSAYYPTGVAIAANVATVRPSGRAIDSFTVFPALSPGLSISVATGAISGTPSAAGAIACTVTVWTAGGSAKCGLTITVYDPPVITAQPANVTVNAGGNASFTLSASGSAPLSYQWWRAGSPIAGAASATYSITGAGIANDNTAFKCVVKYSPTGDSAVSSPCTLRVLEAPIISAQPQGKTVRRGGPVLFSIAASGTAPLSYVWTRNGDTVTQTTGSTLTLPSAQKTDDLSLYRCFVNNIAGSAESAPCTLRVVAAGFGAAPRSGIDSLTVQFMDSSTGGITSYSWDFGDGSAPATTADPRHFYGKTGVYSVKQTVSGRGVVDSAFCLDCIIVKSNRPAVAFIADTLWGLDSLTVSFSDMSKGTVTAKRWDFGDGATDTSRAGVITHRYGNIGVYTVKLVESGPGGIDSLVRKDYIKILASGDYSVAVKARRLSADSVEIRFTGVSSIPTSKTAASPAWADSLGLWFRRGGIPASAADSFLKGYTIAALQQTGRDPFVDTVRVPFSPPADSVFYGFNAAAFWVNRPASVMKSSGGDLVLMRDTVRPVNPLTVSGAYRGIDTFALFLDAVSALDTSDVDSVGIWYGFKKAPDFTDAQHTRWFASSGVVAGAPEGRFAIALREDRLNGDTARMYCAVMVAGKNRLKSAVSDSSFTAGRLRPVNPIRLRATAQNPTSIKLTWRETGTGRPVTGVDSIIIWRGAKPLPQTFLPPSSDFTALRPSVGDTAFSCGGLNEKTRYYFGGQVHFQGLWSSITDSACATDSTPAVASVEKAVRILTMTKLAFDEAGGRIMTGWRIDSLDSGMEIGIAYSTLTYQRDSLFPPSQIVKAAVAADSAAVAVGNLEWDSTYYVSLWLRKKGGAWRLPTPEAERSVRLPAEGSWQAVKYFTKYPDTVTVFGGKLLLAAGSEGAAVPTADTVRQYDAPATFSKGFAAVSRTFSFAQHLAAAPFQIGVRYAAESIPPPFTAKDVRLYLEKQGELFVQPLAAVDTVRHVVWCRVNDAGLPFLAAVDTVAPLVELVSRVSGPVPSGRDIADTFRIRDNIANARYRYWYAKGDGGGEAADSGEVSGGKAVVTASIDGSCVNQENGVRASFTVSDGPHSVTLDVSRQVLRDSSSDAVTMAADTWYPLKTPALLDSPSVKHALRDLGLKGKWQYDNTAFRLFRWCAYAGNATDSVKWVEYDEARGEMFDLAPGRLVWIKTRKNTTLHLGRGRTTPLTTCYSMTAEPRTWTDIALPFGFSVRVGDVIDSINAVSGAGGAGDSLQFYSWNADGKGRYRPQALFIGDFGPAGTTLADKGDSLRKDAGGFTIYNPLSTPVTVRIPPVPAALSRHGKGATAKAALRGWGGWEDGAAAVGNKTPQRQGGWAVRIAATTESGLTLSDVFCGFREGATGMDFYPVPPSFSGAGVRVCDDLKRPRGHGLARGTWSRENGVVFPLVFSGSPDRAETISISIGNLEKLPKNSAAVLYDAATGKFEDASAGLSPVQVGKGGASYRLLAIGTESYLKKVKREMREMRLALVAAFSNSGGRALRIRYTLPFAGVSGVRFTMVDVSGKVVWDRLVACGRASGMQEFVYGGRNPMARGVYILRMSAWDERRCAAGTFQRKVTYLPKE